MVERPINPDRRDGGGASVEAAHGLPREAVLPEDDGGLPGAGGAPARPALGDPRGL